MINGKLGKRPPIDKPALRFGAHLTSTPQHPLADLAPSESYPMDLNDRYGCCVVAGADHTLQTIVESLRGPGSYTNWPDSTIIQFYKSQNPDFDPETDTNDNGMVIQTFLEYLVKNAYILAFAKVDVHNEEEVKAAIYLGLGLMVGQVLTQSQESQQVWDYVPNDPEIGGHCTAWVGYPGTPDNFSGVTWGEVVDVTQEFVRKQVDEAWFVLTQDHINHPNFRANYDLASFAQAYTDLTGKKFPVPVEPPTPTPAPVPTPSPTPAPTPEDADARLWALLQTEWHHIRQWAKEKGL